MKKIIAMLACLGVGCIAFAQSDKSKISLTVQDEKGKPLDGATVELLSAKDSVLIKTAVADAAGAVEWDGVAAGSYIARISAVGFTTQYSKSIDVREGSAAIVEPIQLAIKAADAMQGITVTAKKPFIQKLSDRIVVNVENSIVSAGSSALDVLERSPGITVDGNDAISLRGRAGVIIMIDGKPTPLTGADLANYLRNLPANALERIDIITNPSAKYDAAGNSGIIDLRMKKDQRLGANGTYTINYGQGVYPKASSGITINYRNKGVNIFGNYTYSYRENLNHLIINRNFYERGIFKGSDDKDNYSYAPSTAHPIRVGADFFPSKKSIIGVVVNANLFKLNRKATIQTIANGLSNQPMSTLYSTATNKDRSNNVVANINFKHNFDKGRELSADADYGIYKSSSLTRTSSSYYNLDGSRKRADDILDGDQDGILKLRTAKIDYASPLRAGEKWEAGFKSSYVSSDNEAKFYNVVRNVSTPDNGKTNHFYYNEYNNAAYINYAREMKKLSVQLGLRGENTNLDTKQVKGNKTFSNQYFQLFPSAFFNYKLKENKTVGVSVSRRIDRPGYYQLNPFLFQVDANIYSTGDPLLKPQMSWSYELSYTVKNINVSLGYTYTKNAQSSVLSKILDVIPNFEIQAGQDSNITVQVPVNLNYSENVGLTLSAPFRVTKWWNIVNNLNIYHNHFNGNLGGTPLNNGTPSANIRTNHTFTFGKTWTAEFGANIFTGGRSGYMLIEPQWGLSAGLQKLIMKGNGTLRFNITDIFWTNLPKATVEYPGSYVENWHAFRETRVANFTFTYRFGNNKVQQSRRRSTASEEERQRVN